MIRGKQQGISLKQVNFIPIKLVQQNFRTLLQQLRHKKITKEIMAEYQQEDFLQLFLSLLEEINQYYTRILPFQSMFYEFLQKGNVKVYRAAIELLRELSEENKEDGKIIEKIEHSWYVASRNVTHNIGRLRLKRYLSVLANLELRKQYFGF